MSDIFLENSTDFLESLATKYPGSRKDLIRLVDRVLMDARNAMSRSFGEIEMETKSLAKAEVQN